MRKLFLLGILFVFARHADAQYHQDIGIVVGGANYLGDIGGDEKTRRDFVMDMKVGQTRWAIGGFYRYRVNPLISLRTQLTYARIQGADNLSTNPGRVGRNITFRNDIFELGGLIDVNFYQVNDVGRTGRYRTDFKGYGFLGVAGLYHNPKAPYNGGWEALRPLQTEGVAYKPFAFAVPMGLGFYYTFQRKYRLGWEIGWRATFTDYLDDVSTVYATPEQLGNDPKAIALANRRPELGDQAGVPAPENYLPGQKRGDPTHNDNYFFTTINFSYVIRGKSSFYRSKFNFVLGNKRKRRTTRAKF